MAIMFTKIFGKLKLVQNCLFHLSQMVATSLDIHVLTEYSGSYCIVMKIMCSDIICVFKFHVHGVYGTAHV